MIFSLGLVLSLQLPRLTRHLISLALQEVQECGGTIVNFIGDAVLAVFGVPQPQQHSADAALACYMRCAARLEEERSRRMSVRLGITEFPLLKYYNTCDFIDLVTVLLD